MENNNLLLIVCVLAVIGLIVVFTKCLSPCKQQKKEGYRRKALSENGPMKRTPVDYAFKQGGITNDPHYYADPGNKLVPLEIGTTDLYAEQRNVQNGYAFESMGACYKGRGNKETYLVNDNKTRRDMIDSGDLSWNRYLNNMQNPHATYSASPTMTITEADLTMSTPWSFQEGLYEPKFFEGLIGQ